MSIWREYLAWRKWTTTRGPNINNWKHPKIVGISIVLGDFCPRIAGLLDRLVARIEGWP